MEATLAVYTISRSDVVPLLADACPTFEAGAADEPLYVELGRLAQHCVELARAGQLGPVTSVLAVVERLHVEGDPYVREAATIGFLEAVQNVALHYRVPLVTFEPLLGVESRRWWCALVRFWAGEIARVDPDL